MQFIKLKSFNSNKTMIINTKYIISYYSINIDGYGNKVDRIALKMLGDKDYIEYDIPYETLEARLAGY